MNKDMKLKQDYSYGLIPFCWESSEPRYFVGRSVDTDGSVGFWKFPKGHKEEGESDLQTAMRETAEEIGVYIDESSVFTGQSFEEEYEYDNEIEKVEKTNTYWLAEVDSGEEVKLSDEFSEYDWVSFEEALELLPENSRSFLKEAHSTLLQST